MSILMPHHVLLTGATGFLGSHTVRALLGAGHRVRALVRDPDKAARVFGDASGALEITTGDIGDPGSIEAALEGCDAVIHCAAVVALDSANDPNALIETNVSGVRHVIGAALDRGIKRVVHVSSIAPLFRRDGTPVTETSELQTSNRAYSQSKMMADEYVRARQAEGEPVKILYPGAIIGPDDPGLTESMKSIQIFACTFLPLTTSGIQYVDVRDLALALVRVIEDEPGSGRYLAAGRFIPWRELAELLERATGRRPPAFQVPAPILRLAGRVADAIRILVKVDLPLSLESAIYVTQWTPIESSRELDRLGIRFRSLEESIFDTVRWMQDAGHL